MSSLRERNSQSESSTGDNLQDEREIKRSSKKFFSPFVILPIFIRLIATIIFMIMYLPILWVFCPLRMLHPMLRRQGIPNGKLPLDVLARSFTYFILKLQAIEVTFSK